MKAILVVDIPDNFKFKKSFADITLFDGKHNMWKRIAEVKPMPEKRKYLDYDLYAGSGFDRGWNACIDEILREEQ